MSEELNDGFKPDAKDGDKDGFVQDGTKWERPVDTLIVEEVNSQERNKFTYNEPEVQQTESEKVAEDFGVNASIAEVEESPAIITGPSYTSQEEVQSLGSLANGAIGATKKTRAKKTTVKVDSSPETVEKIAIHSDKNYYWGSAGKIYRGYNIVAKEKADKWLTRTGVRLATPEEVAKEFGV